VGDSLVPQIHGERVTVDGSKSNFILTVLTRPQK